MADRSVSVFLKAHVGDFQRGMLAAGASAKAFGNELDTSTDRATNLTQSLLAITPTLVPIGAAAVPALSGVTNQLAFAAAGAGVMVLAFQGVGDALKATNEYAIEPTDANLQKMRESLDKLGPAGQEFVSFLQQIRPELQELQDAAQNGLFPGAEDGIRELMELMPQAERLVSTIATTVGDVIAEGGDNLNDARWVEFFDFLETEARPTLIDTTRTLGNFAEGWANLWMAFDPVSDDFSASFLEMSRDFANWSDGLDQTEGFQEFVDYIDENGPEAWETLSALGGALLQIVEAAAPVGSASLPIIKALADTLGAIADSPVGPVLIGAAAGISAISRAVALYKVTNGSAITGFLGLANDKGKQAGLGMRAAAAGIGIYALSLTDLDEKMGITNTATLAMAGSVLGPWGTAIGGAIGLAKDLAASNDSIEDAFKRADSAIRNNTGSLAEQRKALEAARAGAQLQNIVGANDVDKALSRIHLAELADQLDQNTRKAQDLKFAEAGLASTMLGASQATRDQTAALLDNIDAHNKLSNELLAAQDGMVAYEQAVDDATAAAKKNGETLDITTQAGRDNDTALRAVAATWNNLTEEQQNAAGASESARANFIRTAEQMGATRAEAKRLADQYLEIPRNISTKVNADVVAALNKLRGLQEYINGMNGKTLKIHIEGGTPGGILRASGGPIFGPGSGTSDDVPVMASNGEHMMSAAEVRAAGGHQAVAAWRASLLAGTTTTTTREFAGGAAQGSAGSTPALDTQSFAVALATATERAMTKSLSGAYFYMAPDGSIQLKNLGA